MVDYNADVPDVPNVEKPQPELSDEQKKQKVEKRLAEPAVFEFTKAKAEKEGKEINEFLTGSDDEAIAEMIEEYEEKVEPTVKAYGKFLNEAFLKNLSVIDNKVRQDASEKAEVCLVRLYLEDEAKFGEYQELIDKHKELEAEIKEKDTELRRNFGSNDLARLEADRQYLENRTTAGDGVATENQTNFNTERNRIRSITIFSREGWNNRISALRNFFGRRGYRSDAEISETEKYEGARDELAAKIQQLRERQQAIGEGIDKKNELLEDVGNVREELLEAMHIAGDMRKVLLEGLKEAMKGGKYDPSKAGETIGALDEMWKESEADGTPDYEDYRKEINIKLIAAFKLILKKQIDSVKETINPRMLQEFGSFVDNSVKTQEAKDLVEEELKSAIESTATEPVAAKKAHLAMMLRRVQSKEF